MADATLIEELRLQDFRCFEHLRFRPASGTNFILGANAQGKTSILEAVCVAARLQSPRVSALAEVVRQGTSGAAVDLRGGGRHLHFRLEPPKRRLTLDSVEQSGTTEYLGAVRVAWFSNDDMEIVRGSGARRRRYLDFVCSQIEPVYVKHLRTYERALRSRNALLKDGRPAREVEAFDPVLVASGNALTAARASAIEALAPEIQNAVTEIGGAADSVDVQYESGGEVGSALQRTRDDEIRLRQTIAGPHRDDVALALNRMEAGRFSSEGQQRTLALALKLAQTRIIIARTGALPVLLIDDVFGELDLARRSNLLAGLPAGAQALITTTHLDWLGSGCERTVFRLASHALRRESGT